MVTLASPPRAQVADIAGASNGTIVSGVADISSSTLRFAARIGGDLQVDLPLLSSKATEGQTQKCMRLDKETGTLTEGTRPASTSLPRLLALLAPAADPAPLPFPLPPPM